MIFSEVKVKTGQIIESGHYYSVKGPTIWSKIGWEILEEIKSKGDESAIFIDDFHQNIEDIHPKEKEYQEIFFQPNAQNVFYENSEQIKNAAEEMFQQLLKIKGKMKVRQRPNGEICINGKYKIPLKSPDDKLSCVLLDAGLSLLKYRLGFCKAINILPSFYENEQRKLLIILNKVLPEFKLKVILYNLDGKYWEM